MSPLRRRIENSTLLAGLIAGLAGTYLKLCHWTTRWEITGRDALEAELANGPVLLMCWHGRLLMAALDWPQEAGGLSSLHDGSPIGRVAGALHRQTGLQPMQMARGTSNRAASRMVLRRARDGVSIGLAADGPVGPRCVVQDAPLEWARVTGLPVWGYAFGTTRHRKLSSWDQMILPRPFGKGRVVFARWDHALPRRANSDQMETARASLAEFLDDVTKAADQGL